MSKISKIALFPYFAYIAVKSFFRRNQNAPLVLKKRDYKSWLEGQEEQRNGSSASTQKLIAVVDEANVNTTNSLNRASIDVTVEPNEFLSAKNKQLIDSYDGVFFLKAGETIVSSFKKGLPTTSTNNIVYFDHGELSGDTFRPKENLPDWNPDYFWSKNYISRGFLVHPSIVDRQLKLNDDLLSAILAKNSTLTVHHHRATLVHLHRITTDHTYRSQLIHQNLPEVVVKRHRKFPVFDLHFPVLGTPLISIIIPTKDGADVLANCLESILEKSTYRHFEFIILDNNSSTSAFKKLKLKWSKKNNCTFISHNAPFNYSELNNIGAQHANGEYFVFLNNDTEVISTNWLEDLVGKLQRPHIGAVGAQLLFEDNTIQHAGVKLGIEGVASHVFSHMPINTAPEFSQTSSNYKALTGACLSVSKKHFELVKGFDEHLFAVEFNDLDFCLKLIEEGLQNVYLPFVQLYHYESLSRGSTHKSWASLLRYRSERKNFVTKWGTQLADH